VKPARASDPWAWGVGLHFGPTDISVPIVELAVAAEQRGFDSMFVPEHTHIPAARTTPYPGGGEIPDRYLRVLDPLVGLSFVAAQTNMVVGTCVSLPGEHDPIAHAKAVATIDHLSGGRFVMGIGFGWNQEEFADHGFRAEDRWDVVAEKIELMKQLWTNDVGGFEGRHVRVSPSWSWPKPVQQPHPPVLVGGFASAPTFRRVCAWGDGWIPMGMDVSATLPADLERLRRQWADAGRDPDRLYVAVMQKPEPVPRVRELLQLYRSLGVTRVLMDLPSEPSEVVFPMLDALAPALVGLT
jgi:probable F420-dependent oxidoreductase